MSGQLRPPSERLLSLMSEAARLSEEVRDRIEATRRAEVGWIRASTPDEKRLALAQWQLAETDQHDWQAKWDAVSASIMRQRLDENNQLSEADKSWFRQAALPSAPPILLSSVVAQDAAHRVSAQSSVAPGGSPSVAPEAGAPTSAPRVTAGMGQTPEGDGGDGKDGQ